MKRALLYTGLAAVVIGAASTAVSRGRRHTSEAREDLARAGFQPDQAAFHLGRAGRVPALAAILPHDGDRRIKATYGSEGWTPRGLIEADGTYQPLPESAQRPIKNRATLSASLGNHAATS